MPAWTTRLAAVGVLAALWLPRAAHAEAGPCASGVCGEGEEVQLLQDARGCRAGSTSSRCRPARVQCTYSLNREDTCRGDECCPGAAETGWKTYPCPNAGAGFTCGRNGAPKPISCGQMTAFGQRKCEQDEYCRWQVWKKDINTPYPEPDKPKDRWTESCVFSKKYSETCYPPPGGRHNLTLWAVFNTSNEPSKIEWWKYDVPCDQAYVTPWGASWPANNTLPTNSGWPDLGMDWNGNKAWAQLDAAEEAAATQLGWDEAAWQSQSVGNRGDPSAVAMFPPSATKYWVGLSKDEQDSAGVLGWDERLWNWNALSMKGAHTFGDSWVPVVYEQWAFLQPYEQEGMLGLGYVGQSQVNKVFWQDTGYGEGIPGDSWPSSQCQDWAHVNQTAGNQVMQSNDQWPNDYVWMFYHQMLAPMCPKKNPRNMKPQKE